jgi:pathogenesis-related protein 1
VSPARPISPIALLVLATLSACANTETATASTGSNPDPGSLPTRSARDPEPASSKRGSVDPVAEAFVSAHNRVRAQVSPAANPPLAPVTWDPVVAAHAQAWANNCEFEHSQTDYGENLSARTDAGDPAEAVMAWAGEVQHFDYRRNRCASGQVCGHYTQVVWRSSARIGCATARCTRNSPFGGGAWALTVCNYDPPGNWTGEKPY